MKSKCHKTGNKLLGFTLIELMVTLSVLGILLALAAPSLRDFLVANRLSTNVNSVIGLLNYARSEAIVRNQAVAVCARDGASGQCSTSQFWGELELMVFVDVNGNNNFDAGDEMLKTTTAVDVSNTQMAMTVGSNIPNFVGFGANGMSQRNFRLNINAIGDAAYELKYGRTICISRPGRARVGPLLSVGGLCPAQ